MFSHTLISLLPETVFLVVAVFTHLELSCVFTFLVIFSTLIAVSHLQRENNSRISSLNMQVSRRLSERRERNSNSKVSNERATYVSSVSHVSDCKKAGESEEKYEELVHLDAGWYLRFL